jgi:hypothetical protein
LKNRSKKLLLFRVRGLIGNGPRQPAGKGFLVLFFKKERLAFHRIARAKRSR